MKTVVYPSTSAKIDKYMMSEKLIPGILLMERAAGAVAFEIVKLMNKGEKAAVLCGPGNNGGDGYAAARILLSYGIDTVCFSVIERVLPDDSELNRSITINLGNGRYVDASNMSAEDIFKYLETYDVIVDAIFGVGFSRPLDERFAKLADLINNSGKRVVAVDIPSGVFGASGYCEIAIKADVTVTFQYMKPGHLIYPGAEYVGEVKVYPIGIDDGVFGDISYVDEISMPKRKRNTNKGNYGTVVVTAGSKGMAGAAVLCASSAVAAGAGLTKVVCPEAVLDIMQMSVPVATCRISGDDTVDPGAMPEDVYLSAKALAVGPGMGKSDDTANTVKKLIAYGKPTVVDADAINSITAEDLRNKKNVIITPHPKEFSRIFGISIKEILKDPVEIAKKYAFEYGVNILLKGASSVITDGNEVYIVNAGCPSMAKGGSGDVLTGCIAAFMAQGMDIIKAAYSAAFICGKAGELSAEKYGEYAAKASNTVENIGIVIRNYQEK